MKKVAKEEKPSCPLGLQANLGRENGKVTCDKKTCDFNLSFYRKDAPLGTPLWGNACLKQPPKK